MTQATTPAAPPQKSSSTTKILLTCLTLILLCLLAVLGSCFYVAYRAKKKADEIREAYKTGDVDKIARSVGIETTESSKVSQSLDFPDWKPSDGASAKIPVVSGLTAVCAVAQFGGDYQSVMRILNVTPEDVSLSVRADNVPNPLQKGGEGGTVYATRTVRAEDMRNAHELQEWFNPNHPDTFEGTTAVSASREVLSELRNKGETQFTFGLGGLKGLFGSLVNPIGEVLRQTGQQEQAKSMGTPGKATCTLKRVGNVAFPVLINDQRVSVRALHAQCTADDGVADFYFLDDLDNPAVLAFKLGDSGDAVEVISIAYPFEKPPAKAPTPIAASNIEKQLEEQGKAEVYGIYFDFGSDKMKPESDIVLREIASALDHNPAWRLRVEGHTDNKGADAYNMELSQRRAAAVKKALMTRYHIDESRLTPQGFGATRPKESNDSVAGRARNRRVELVRL